MSIRMDPDLDCAASRAAAGQRESKIVHVMLGWSGVGGLDLTAAGRLQLQGGVARGRGKGIKVQVKVSSKL